MTQQQIDMIIDLRKSGYSVKEIARKVSTSTESVCYWCQKVGITKATGYTASGKHYNVK